MTIEHKIVVGVEDIEAVIVECASEGCGYKVSFPPSKFQRIPDRCDQCGKVWGPTSDVGYIGTKAWPFANLISALRQVSGLVQSGAAPGFRILFEFKADQGSK